MSLLLFVCSHKKAAIKVISNWEILLQHQQYLLDSNVNDETKARALMNMEFLKDQEAMISLAFLIDLQEVFSIESQLFQKKGKPFNVN